MGKGPRTFCSSPVRAVNELELMLIENVEMLGLELLVPSVSIPNDALKDAYS